MTLNAYFEGEGANRAFYYNQQFMTAVLNSEATAVALYEKALKERLEFNTPWILKEPK